MGSPTASSSTTSRVRFPGQFLFFFLCGGGGGILWDGHSCDLCLVPQYTVYGTTAGVLIAVLR